MGLTVWIQIGLTDTTQVPGSVVERGQGGSVSRERELGDQKRSAGGGDTETEADQASGTDEHPDVLRRGPGSVSHLSISNSRLASLKSGGDEHDAASAENTHPSTELVGDAAGEGKR